MRETGPGSPGKSEGPAPDTLITDSLMMGEGRGEALKAKLRVSEGSLPNLLTLDIKMWQVKEEEVCALVQL